MRKILVKLFLLIGTVGLFAQTGNHSIEYPNNAFKYYSGDMDMGSARYIGLGGAVGALGGDISSVEQNPAGLGVSVTSEVMATLGVRSHKTKTTFNSSASESESGLFFGQAGISMVFHDDINDWNRFVFGINFTGKEIDNTARVASNNKVVRPIELEDENGQVTIDYVRFGGHLEETTGYKNKISLNFGTSYKDQIYLGAALNFHETRIDGYTAYSEISTDDGYVYNMAKQNTPYREIGQGFSLGLGVIGKVNHNLRLGAAYHSPVWYNNIDRDFWQATDDGYLDPYYFEYDLKTGGRLVGSVGVVVGKSFAIDADYTYHMNEGNKFKPSGEFADDNKFISDYVKNSNEFRIGGEYRYEGLKLRAGFGFVESPYKKMEYNFINDQGTEVYESRNDILIGDKTKFSLGAGYDFGGFYLDFAFQHQKQKYSNIVGGADYYGSNYITEIPVYTTSAKANQNLYLLTAGWLF